MCSEFVRIIASNALHSLLNKSILGKFFTFALFMNKLLLLFTQGGLQYQLSKSRNVLEEQPYFLDEEAPENFLSSKLEEILQKNYDEVRVISALNRFSLLPIGFKEHQMGHQLINYNAPTDEQTDELMLSINKPFGVQFYYTFPKEFYHKIKGVGVPSYFNFSGEKFLSSISPKNQKEIHINLYHHQCEFIALDKKKLILYNNLDINSEVDFLYFIMFTLSKIGFGIHETHFFIYGETTENETFISELQKFVKRIKIIVDNIPKRNFILNY